MRSGLPTSPPPRDRVLRVGLVGPGRTRNGLGPFLARHLAAAGARVVAVAGREPERAKVAAAALAQQLGHDVQVRRSVEDLAASGLDAFVVASPIDAHVHALRAGLAARLPTLCEKPLCDLRDAAAARAIVADYAALGVPLVENCQWPFALAALVRAGAASAAPAEHITMRLSPTGVGRDMLIESLSHLLSLVQATMPTAAAVDDVKFSTARCDAKEMSVDLRLRGEAGLRTASLDLVHCPRQPRPAWFTLDGARFERELVLPAYHWRFQHAQGSNTIGDPQADLVYSFVQLVSEPDLDIVRTIARSHAATIEVRARFFADIVAAYEQAARR